MPSYKISQLPATGGVTAGTLFEISKAGVSEKATLTEVTALVTTAYIAADAVVAASVTAEATTRANADTALTTDVNLRLKADGSTPLTADWALGSFKITGLVDPTVPQGAATKAYADLKLALTGGTMSGAIAMGTNKITGMGDPTNPQDAVTLAYLTTASLGFWSLTGNSPGNDTSFIGTSDNQDFLLKTNATTRMYFLKTGEVGVGITPDWKLDVASNNETTAYCGTLQLRNIGSGLNYTETAINFNSSLSGNADFFTARIVAHWDGTSANVDARLSGQVDSGSGLVNVWSIRGGKFGILNTNPQEALDLVGNQQTVGQTFSKKYTLTDGATIALDWNNSNVQYVVLGGNRTFTFANPKDGAIYTLLIKQGGAGSYTLTWPATIAWGGGAAPTLTTTVGKTDTIRLVYDATNTKYYDISTVLNH